MSVPMSKEEIALTINRMQDDNERSIANYDRVIERMCNYIDANLDDFMECYNEPEKDMFGDEPWN